MAVPQQTVIKLQLYAARKKKIEKSSFVNKLSGQTLQLAQITLHISQSEDNPPSSKF